MVDYRKEFFELAPMPCAVVNGDGDVIETNAAWSQLLSVTRSSARVRHLELVHPDDRKRVEEAMQDARFHYVARYRRASRWKGLEIYGTRQPGGERLLAGRPVLTPAGVPMTERTFAQILDAVSEMVLVKGPGSRILWANRAFRDLYGMTNEELENLLDAPFVQPDFTQKYVRDDAFVFETGQRLEVGEEPVMRHDGERRLVHTVKVPLFDESGRVMISIGLSRDVTEQRRAEVMLEEQRQKMLATAKMSALGEMASGIAHEINNPLAVIHLRAAQLRELAGAPEVNAEFVARAAEKIEAVSLRIAKIVRGLRAFARDAEPDPPQPVRLITVIEDTLEMCAERLQRERVQLNFENRAGADLTVECRSVQIVQVLLNLLNNALDAIAELPERWIRLTLTREDRWLVLHIIDSGRGIPELVARQIFQPFFTTKEAGKGTGLGLSVSKGIIEAHGGTLTFDNQSANTSFRLCLPLVAPSRK